MTKTVPLFAATTYRVEIFDTGGDGILPYANTAFSFDVDGVRFFYVPGGELQQVISYFFITTPAA